MLIGCSRRNKGSKTNRQLCYSNSCYNLIYDVHIYLKTTVMAIHIFLSNHTTSVESQKRLTSTTQINQCGVKHRENKWTKLNLSLNVSLSQWQLFSRFVEHCINLTTSWTHEWIVSFSSRTFNIKKALDISVFLLLSQRP